MRQFRHQFAGSVTRLQTHFNFTHTFTPRTALAPQLLQPPHASFSTHPPRLDALTYPYFFLRQHLVKLGVEHRFVLQHLLLETQVSRKITGETSKIAAI